MMNFVRNRVNAFDCTLRAAMEEGHSIVFGRKVGHFTGFVTSPSSDAVTEEFEIHLLRDFDDDGGVSLSLITAMTPEEAADAGILLGLCLDRVKELKAQAQTMQTNADAILASERCGQGNEDQQGCEDKLAEQALSKGFADTMRRAQYWDAVSAAISE